jgi:hypothetical protein
MRTYFRTRSLMLCLLPCLGLTCLGLTCLGLAVPVSAEPAATSPSPGTPAPAATQAAAPDGSVHPDVQRALSYQVPAPTCTPPEIRRSNQNAGQLERNERATKRYTKCLEAYQQGLFDDFKFMQSVVRHGVTMPQAEQIAGNMSKIADAIKSLKGRGVALAQDQARIISTGLSGNRQLPGAQ